MKCDECKNFEAKEKPQRVTVLTFDRDGKQGSYSFSGKPDWARIERETIGAGMMAVIVKLPKDAVRIAQRWLGMDGWYRDYTGAIPNSYEFTGIALFCRYSISVEIDRIQSAIAAWRERQPKPWAPQVGEKVWWDGVAQGIGKACDPCHTIIIETSCAGYRVASPRLWVGLDHLRPASEAPEHYDGEPCELQVYGSDISFAYGFRFVYTNDKTALTLPNDWFVSHDKSRIMRASSGCFIGNPRWILRAVPVEAKPGPMFPKVGDIIHFTEANSCCGAPVPIDCEVLRYDDHKQPGEMHINEQGRLDQSWRDDAHGLWGKHWIVRPVETKPEWMQGDYAFDTARSDYGIVEVGDVWNKGVSVWVRSLAANLNRTAKYTDLRPLEPADWTREIGGVKVRAYEKECGDICIKAGDKSICVGTNEFKSVLREFCRLANLPIMPFALHRGKMDPPE